MNIFVSKSGPGWSGSGVHYFLWRFNISAVLFIKNSCLTFFYT